MLVFGREDLGLVKPKYVIYTPKQDDEHPRPFDMGVPPGVSPETGALLMF